MSPDRFSRRSALAAIAAMCWGAARPLVWSQEASAHVADAALRVLFFNTHLLPAIAQSVAGKRGQDDYRTQAIAAAVAPYDLVGLCEVFEARRRREIVAAVERAAGGDITWVESPRRTGTSVIGGGLLLLSRFPLEGEPHAHAYTAASRVLTNGFRADGLAAKGVLHARLLVSASPPLVVDCFLTHLESISAEARAEQIQELGEFIAEHASAERPMILMGDLNVAADEPAAAGDATTADTEYRRLRQALRVGEAQLVDLWPAVHTARGGTSDALAAGECRRIDYVFLSPPTTTVAAQWQARDVRVEPFLDAAVTQGSLSDHAGIACRLDLAPAALR
jgi:endonuclease/exonuclease/phosphatase family metal-dependent hydrolase